jgi:hypothetical protein
VGGNYCASLKAAHARLATSKIPHFADHFSRTSDRRMARFCGNRTSKIFQKSARFVKSAVDDPHPPPRMFFSLTA